MQDAGILARKAEKFSVAELPTLFSSKELEFPRGRLRFELGTNGPIASVIVEQGALALGYRRARCVRIAR